MTDGHEAVQAQYESWVYPLPIPDLAEAIAEVRAVLPRQVAEARGELPHMLRHATGFYLANAGQDTRAIQLYLGHKNIQHTVRYTEVASGLFKDFWKN